MDSRNVPFQNGPNESVSKIRWLPTFIHHHFSLIIDKLTKISVLYFLIFLLKQSSFQHDMKLDISTWCEKIMIILSLIYLFSDNEHASKIIEIFTDFRCGNWWNQMYRIARRIVVKEWKYNNFSIWNTFSHIILKHIGKIDF